MNRFSWTVAVPATIVFLTSLHMDNLLPMCLLALVISGLTFHLVSSDAGLCSLLSLSAAIIYEYWKRIQKDKKTPVEEENMNRKQEKDLLVQDSKKKILRKERRRKRGKSMDDENESLQKSTIPKVYKTLSQFQALAMDSRSLYRELSHYTLSRQELMKNKYPLPCHLGVDSRWPRTHLGLIRRVCIRCHEVFYVNSINLEYTKKTECFYHPVKISGNVYRCCNGSVTSRGCSLYHCHVASEPILDDHLFRETREKRQVRADCDRVYGLDCEMCITTVGLQVTKIGLVNVEGLTIYESFVQPNNPILDYVTQYSGVTAHDLKGVTTTLQDVQEVLLRLFDKNTILIGHGLENDLKMLRLVHEKIVDTSVVFPRPDGRKRKLKDLCYELLGESIQTKEHDSIEDARACVALMLHKIKMDTKIRMATDENLHRFLHNQIFNTDPYIY